MSNEYVDPSGNTEQFKAFVHAPQAKAAVPSRMPLIVGAVVVIALIALVAFLLLG